MISRKRIFIILGVILLTIVTLSCRVYFVTSTPIPDTPTPTPIPPTTTPTPPTSTPTYVPPTNTPTPLPPTPTPTPASLSALLNGRWVAEVEGGELIYFEFNDGEITISFFDELFLEGRYTADFSFDPGHVDLIFEDEEDIFLIVEFLNENTMRIDGGDSPGDRPTTFSGETLKFVRDRTEDE